MVGGNEVYSVSSMMYLAKKIFHLNPSRLENSQFIRNAGKEEKKNKTPQGVEESLESRKWDNGYCPPEMLGEGEGGRGETVCRD